MTADVEAAAPELDAAGNAAHDVVGLEDHGGAAELAQLERCRQSGGPGADHYGTFGHMGGELSVIRLLFRRTGSAGFESLETADRTGRDRGYTIHPSMGASAILIDCSYHRCLTVYSRDVNRSTDSLVRQFGYPAD